MRAGLIRAVCTGAAAALGGTLALTAAGQPPADATGGTPARLVAKLTGPGSINATDTRYQVKATDLGIPWQDGAGHVLVAFGDTDGTGWTGPGGGVGNQATLDWRCNTLARSTDHRLADGMSFDSMVTDRPGHAGQLLPCAQDGNDAGGEVTVIPTAGVSVGHRNYLAYMSVRHWGPAGHWDTSYAGIAYSDDDGRTWTKAPGARWSNTAKFDDPFQMVGLARRDGYVYMYGTPSGRYGQVHLARVPEERVLDRPAYQYWTGSAWHAGADTLAASIVPAPVGELSVQYNAYAHRWLMMYLEDPNGVIVLREAASPTGPWTNRRVVASSKQYPGLYGGFLHPWSSGPDLYFTMSQWDPYNVFLMRTTVTRH